MVGICDISNTVNIHSIVYVFNTFCVFIMLNTLDILQAFNVPNICDVWYFYILDRDQYEKSC